MAERALYAITISMDEAREDMQANMKDAKNSKLGKICDCPGFVGVYPDPAGRFVAFLFESPLKRNEAYKVASTLFATAAVMLKTAYVDEKYLTKH